MFYEELLLNEAEEFFSKMIEDLTQVYISRLVDTYIPESVLSQLTTRSTSIFRRYAIGVYSRK